MMRYTRQHSASRHYVYVCDRSYYEVSSLNCCTSPLLSYSEKWIKINPIYMIKFQASRLSSNFRVWGINRSINKVLGCLLSNPVVPQTLGLGLHPTYFRDMGKTMCSYNDTNATTTTFYLHHILIQLHAFLNTTSLTVFYYSWLLPASYSLNIGAF